MNKLEFWELQVGDIIQLKGTGNTYVVTYKFDSGRFAVTRTITATNPSEWALVRKGAPPLSDIDAQRMK